MLQMLAVVVVVTTISALMIGKDYNRMIEDISEGEYEIYNGEYEDFTQFRTGVTVADNGAVSRTSYLGYVNNIIVDNDFIGKGNSKIVEEDAEALSEITGTFILRMVVAQGHFVGAIVMFLLFKYVIHNVIYFVYRLNQIVLSREFIEENIVKAYDKSKEFQYIFNNKHLVYLDILFVSLATYVLRISVNVGEYDFILVLIGAYVLVALINYLMEKKIREKKIN